MKGINWDNGEENGNYCSMLGLYWDKMATARIIGDYIGVILGQCILETAIVYRCCIAIMQKRTETTIIGFCKQGTLWIRWFPYSKMPSRKIHSSDCFLEFET